MPRRPPSNPGPGRPKGSVNKVTATVKENLQTVFDRLEGVAGMVEWARNNQTEFYRHYVKLLPKNIELETKGGFTVEFIPRKADD